ncbi:MAG: cytochrome c, partial [Saccharopolyspora rectivirgula]
NLGAPTEQEIYEAMLTGPQNMPKFSDRQLTPEEKEDIIAYIKSVTNGNNNPGGNALGGYGPGPETVVAWVIGLGSLIGLTLWIGARA